MPKLEIRDDLTSLHAYNRWADGRLVEALRKLTREQYVAAPAPGWTSVRATVLHIAGATMIWARRLNGELVTARPSEDDHPTVADVEGLFREGHDAFDRLLASLEHAPDRLEEVWSYRNLQGQEARLPLWAVFRHVVNHATYHRGQAASKLKLLGFEPPVTDLLFWALEHTPEASR